MEKRSYRDGSTAMDRTLKDLDQILSEGDDVFKNGDGSAKAQKKKFFNKLRREMKKLGKKSDKDFSKVLLRRMVEKGVTVIEMLEGEMKKDIYARDAEVAGQLINHVVNIIDKINHINREEQKIELTKKKLELEERKLSGQRNMLPGPSAGGKVINNIIAVGNTAELVDLIREHADNIPEVEIPVEVDIEEEPSENILDANTDSGS